MRSNGRSDVLKPNDIEILDNNIVRHIGMTKLSSKNSTPFQLLLDSVNRDKSLLKEEKFKDLAQQLFLIPDFTKRKTGQLFSSEDKTIIDACNDNHRRFFESLFAKKILIFILNSKRADELKLIIEDLTAFYRSEYSSQNKEFLQHWEDAKKGLEVKNDDLNNSFRVFRPDLINLINEKHFSKHPDNTLLKIYDLHYLTHPISKLKSYKEQHPKGIVEIYDNNYKKRNLYFLPVNRGRISGFGFCKDRPSYHLGIFRSLDQTPHDMRKSSLTSSATRCADRLYMEHPKVARSNPMNWQNFCFSNKYNSCYVNGLSGSTLLEIRSILFFILSVQSKRYQCQFVKLDALFKENFALLKDYYLLIIGLFIYFEGGHTFSEILSIFQLDEVELCINQNLPTAGKTNPLSAQSLLIENEALLQIMKETFLETIEFYLTCSNKNNVCKEIEQRSKPSI